MNIAIVVIAFNRVSSLERLINSLQNAYYDNSQITLIISIDKSSTTSVLEYSQTIRWNHGEKKIIAHEKNLGLKQHVLYCGELIKNYDALIILEDDIIVAPSFYLYAQAAVKFYSSDNNIAGISLYNFNLNYQTELPFYPVKIDSDVYFMKCAQSWGQVWMKNQWNDFIEWYNQNKEFSSSKKLPSTICNWPKSSWLKYHTKYCIEQNKYFVYPYTAYSTNCSDIGTHVKKSNSAYQVPLQQGKMTKFKLIPLNDDAIRYDGFFERIGMGKLLNLPEEKLCINFYDQKNSDGYQYQLTTKDLPFELMSSYQLSLKPYELNINPLFQNKTGIYLYDMSKPYKKLVNRQHNEILLTYLWGYPSLFTLIKKIGIFRINQIYIQAVFRYIKRKLISHQ